MPEPRLIFYGRRKARPLRGGRALALETLPHFALPADGDIAPERLFKNAQKYWLDIGFGNGELLSAWVKDNCDTGYIGIEPFINGVSAFLKGLKQYNVNTDNLRVHMDMAETILPRLTAHRLDVISLLNPDPWPKSRHIKRRFIRPQNIGLLSRALKPGGLFFTCTDSPELAEYMALELIDSGQFTFDATCKSSWETPPSFWAPTRYAMKDMAKSGRMFFLSFRNRALLQ